MAVRRPIVVIDGVKTELPLSDSLPGSGLAQLELDFGSTGVRDKAFSVTVSGVSVGQTIAVWQAADAATGRDADENEMDAIVANARVSATNTVVINALALNGFVSGKYKFNYQVS